MMPSRFAVLPLLLLAAAPDLAWAQAVPTPNVPAERNLSGKRESCSATNETHDQRCSIACDPGQTADCEDGEASDTPTCRCGEPSAE